MDVLPLLFAILIGVPYINAYLCAMYTEKLDANEQIKRYEVPSRLGEMECDVCTAYKEENRLEFNCISQTDSGNRQRSHLESCLESNETFRCDLQLCCCRADDCLDRLRAEFASDSKKESDTSCTVTTRYLKNRQLVKLKTPTNRRQYGNDKLFYNDTNVILVSADNESKRQLESRSGGRYLIRTTCGACSANYRQDGMAMDCIAHEKVYEKCSSLTNYVGGELACDSLGTICCCKGPRCETLFVNKFLGQQLESSTINQPYSRSSSCQLFVPLIILVLLINA